MHFENRTLYYDVTGWGTGALPNINVYIGDYDISAAGLQYRAQVRKMKAKTRLVAILLAVFVVGVLVVFFVASYGGESTRPTYHYRASFDPAMVDGVEKFMRGVAKRWEFRLFEKDRKGSKFITRGMEAFFIALFLKSDPENEWILDISNAGAGTILTLGLYEHEDMPLSELQELDNEVRTGLRERFGIELVPYVERHLRNEAPEGNTRERADDT